MDLKMTPQQLILWTLSQSQQSVVTTSFGNQSAVLLHMVSAFKPLIVWVDTGYNTEATLRYVKEITKRLNLNVLRYSAEPWDGEIPMIDTPEYNTFVDHVKLVPFREAINDIHPEFWITGIRAEQTEHRSELQQIDQIDGITKICPLLDWTTDDMDDYITEWNLPNEPVYFDPTKVLTHRECGLHTTVSLRPVA